MCPMYLCGLKQETCLNFLKCSNVFEKLNHKISQINSLTHAKFPYMFHLN